METLIRDTAERLARATDSTAGPSGSSRRTFLQNLAKTGFVVFAALALNVPTRNVAQATGCCCSPPCGQLCTDYYSNACPSFGGCGGSCWTNTSHWSPGSCWYDSCGCICCDCWCPVVAGTNPSCQNGAGAFECACATPNVCCAPAKDSSRVTVVPRAPATLPSSAQTAPPHR